MKLSCVNNRYVGPIDLRVVSGGVSHRIALNLMSVSAQTTWLDAVMRRASELRLVDALLIETLVVILASVCAISRAARIGLPAPAGYLVAGLVIGPHGVQLIAASDETGF